MMDFHSLQVVARDRQEELRSDATRAGAAVVKRATARRSRTAFAAVLLCRVGRAMVALGQRLECLDSRGSASSAGCVERTPSRT